MFLRSTADYFTGRWGDTLVLLKNKVKVWLHHMVRISSFGRIGEDFQGIRFIWCMNNSTATMMNVFFLLLFM